MVIQVIDRLKNALEDSTAFCNFADNTSIYLFSAEKEELEKPCAIIGLGENFIRHSVAFSGSELFFNTKPSYTLCLLMPCDKSYDKDRNNIIDLMESVEDIMSDLELSLKWIESWEIPSGNPFINERSYTKNRSVGCEININMAGDYHD